MIRALLDGQPAERISLGDSSVLRGDGCFEAVRSYEGRLFALGWHIDRLERSSAALDIPMPDRQALQAWCSKMAERGDGVVRVVLTRGAAIPGDASGPHCVVMFQELPPFSPSVRLSPVAAPWHPAGEWSELAGAKTLSYAPNLAAQRAAKTAGFDDALLVSTGEMVLECPTASVAWVIDGIIETPSLDLYILDSITRRTMFGLAEGRWPVLEGRFDRSRLKAADEMMVMSTVKEITPVTEVGPTRFEPGPVTAELARLFRSAVAGGWGD